MSAPLDPPRIVDGAADHPLATLLRGARHDAPHDHERAALDASLRAALARPPLHVALWRMWPLGVVGVAALAWWIAAHPPRRSAATHATIHAASQPVLAAPAPEMPRPPAPVTVETPDAAAALPVAAEPTAPRCVSAHHVLAVEQARRALRATDFAGALAMTSRDRQLCPRGALREERERIAVEALARQGRHADAARSLATFERTYPGSLHLRTLRAIVDSDATGSIPSRP